LIHYQLLQLGMDLERVAMFGVRIQKILEIGVRSSFQRRRLWLG
jgi:hypothetical protein